MSIKQAAQLRLILLGMEHDLNLEGLTTFERDVLYAATSLHIQGTCIKSDDIKTHEMAKSMAAPTFYRALKVLLEKGFLLTWPGTIKGSYALGQRK